MIRALTILAGVLSFHFQYTASSSTVLPPRDERAKEVRTLNTLRQFPEITSKAAWEKRAKEIREHALVCTGLWPMPEKSPLNANTSGRVERDGYSVEKVYMQTLPGFYLAGNLYRPLGKGKGPFPAVLNPHGHWKEGRMANVELGSIAARCISFARQGMVAFSYDMVGYNDTFFSNYGDVPVEQFSARHHRFATNEARSNQPTLEHQPHGAANME